MPVNLKNTNRASYYLLFTFFFYIKLAKDSNNIFFKSFLYTARAYNFKLNTKLSKKAQRASVFSRYLVLSTIRFKFFCLSYILQKNFLSPWVNITQFYNLSTIKGLYLVSSAFFKHLWTLTKLTLSLSVRSTNSSLLITTFPNLNYLLSIIFKFHQGLSVGSVYTYNFNTNHNLFYFILTFYTTNSLHHTINLLFQMYLRSLLLSLNFSIYLKSLFILTIVSPLAKLVTLSFISVLLNLFFYSHYHITLSSNLTKRSFITKKSKYKSFLLSNSKALLKFSKYTKYFSLLGYSNPINYVYKNNLILSSNTCRFYQKHLYNLSSTPVFSYLCMYISYYNTYYSTLSLQHSGSPIYHNFALNFLNFGTNITSLSWYNLICLGNLMPKAKKYFKLSKSGSKVHYRLPLSKVIYSSSTVLQPRLFINSMVYSSHLFFNFWKFLNNVPKTALGSFCYKSKRIYHKLFLIRPDFFFFILGLLVWTFTSSTYDLLLNSLTGLQLKLKPLRHKRSLLRPIKVNFIKLKLYLLKNLKFKNSSSTRVRFSKLLNLYCNSAWLKRLRLLSLHKAKLLFAYYYLKLSLTAYFLQSNKHSSLHRTSNFFNFHKLLSYTFLISRFNSLRRFSLTLMPLKAIAYSHTLSYCLNNLNSILHVISYLSSIRSFGNILNLNICYKHFSFNYSQLLCSVFIIFKFKINNTFIAFTNVFGRVLLTSSLGVLHPGVNLKKDQYTPVNESYPSVSHMPGWSKPKSGFYNRTLRSLKLIYKLVIKRFSLRNRSLKRLYLYQNICINLGYLSTNKLSTIYTTFISRSRNWKREVFNLYTLKLLRKSSLSYGNGVQASHRRKRLRKKKRLKNPVIAPYKR